MKKRIDGKTVLVTGVTGQDGGFLAKSLLEDGFNVFGALRRGGHPKTERLKSLGIRLEKRLMPSWKRGKSALFADFGSSTAFPAWPNQPPFASWLSGPKSPTSTSTGLPDH